MSEWCTIFEIIVLVKRFILPYTDGMTRAEKTANLLKKSKKTLAIAESCTGGLLAHQLTNIPGSSQFLKAAVIAYSNEAKTKLLKVPGPTIHQFGAVSAQTAMAMAQGARNLLRADYGISITGIAGPGGGSKAKPVGLTYIAVATTLETLCLKCQFTGSRLKIKSAAASEALRLLQEFLI